jgi:glycosyltransferase involved in cell wall biosynthesis
MPLLISLAQPIIPEYRLAVFERLARTAGVELSVWASSRDRGSLRSMSAGDRFRVEDASYFDIGPFVWQSGSLRCLGTPRPDVAILSWNSRAIDLPFALRRCRRLGIGSVLWGHGFGTRMPLVGDWTRRLSRAGADAFMLYGPTGRDRLRSLGFPPERLFVAPNSLDQTPIRAAIEGWTRDPARLAEFRARKGLGEGPLLLYLARLERRKFPHLAIEALARLRHEQPAQLAIIGDGSMRHELESLARSLGVSDRVHFAGALYEDEQIAPWALSATCLVHPGSIGLSILHAFGYGLPVVTSDRVEIQMPEFETLIPDRNGLLYRHGEVDDLARQCDRILADPTLRDHLSEGATSVVTGPKARNIEGMVAGMLEAIDFAASCHGKTRTAGPTG